MRFAAFLGAERVALDPLAPGELRQRVRAAIERSSDLRVVGV
jgi:hypothetical protein